MKCGRCGKVTPTTNHFIVLTKAIPGGKTPTGHMLERILSRVRFLLCDACSQLTAQDFGTNHIDLHTPDDSASLN